MKESHCIETDDEVSFGFDKEDITIFFSNEEYRTITWEEWDKIVEFINSHR